MIEVVRTPIEYFNLIAGGLRFSTLVEAWGANRSGKTTMCYQTIGYFMEDFKDGEVHLLDNESSFDELRCRHVFKWDLKENKKYDHSKQDSIKKDTWLYKRVNLVPIKTLEEGFWQIIQILKAHKGPYPIIIMWDTIDSAPSKSSYESALNAEAPDKMSMYSGGMGDRARIIKHYLQDVMALMFRKRAILLLPNQIHSGIGQYAKAENVGGGNALKHNRHYSFYFKLLGGDNIKYDDMSLVSQVVSDVSLTKSKFSPGFQTVPIFIDVRAGGVIDETQSLMLAANRFGFIQDKLTEKGKRTGWYLIDHPSFGDKPVRWGDLAERRDEFMPTVKKAILAKLASTHFLIKMLYQEMGRMAEVDEALKGVDQAALKAKNELDPAGVIPTLPDDKKDEVVPTLPKKK